VFVGDDNPDLGLKHYFNLIGAVDINGFVPVAWERVRRKSGSNNPDPTCGQERFFPQYVVGTLVPTLGGYANGEPCSVVMMDNAIIHKDPRVRTVIEAAGAVLIWNAAYSPDLNPIERVFSLYKGISPPVCAHRFATEFRWQPQLVHHLALDECVDRKKMCKFYNGKAFEGCIRGVPVVQEHEEEVAVVVASVHAAQRRRKRRRQ